VGYVIVANDTTDSTDKARGTQRPSIEDELKEPNIDDREKSFRWPCPDRRIMEISLGRVEVVGKHVAIWPIIIADM
jgi:hypothetical protein